MLSEMLSYGWMNQLAVMAGHKKIALCLENFMRLERKTRLLMARCQANISDNIHKYSLYTVKRTVEKDG
jgi:hypothetical protein